MLPVQTRFFCLLMLAVSILFGSVPVAVAENSEKPVVIVFQVERQGGFLSEPGNNPVEALRRFGRALNKEWDSQETILTAASVFDSEKVSTPDFLKPVKVDQLSTGQKTMAESLLSRYNDRFAGLIQACQPASESIVIKTACESKLLKEVFARLLGSPEASKKLKDQQRMKIETQLMPILESSDMLLGAMVISRNGAFGRMNIMSSGGNLVNSKIAHDISIGDFINENALMLFCQTHPIENASETMSHILSIPQSATIVGMIASAGLDFENDILANSARESILYANLVPNGDGGLPDLRFVAPVPHVDKLTANLPKFKNLCMQTGIFTSVTTENNKAIVKLSYFMFPDMAVYAGLADNFLILATSRNNLLEEMDYILNIKQGKNPPRKLLANLKRFWRVRSSDFNQQLQKFLQSPLFNGKGIPPVSNLKFLENLGNLEVFSTSTPELIEFIFNLPILTASNNPAEK